jgi:arylsulfatase A-like enzyme
MIVRWPGVIRAGRRDQHSVVSTIDVAPTFLETAGVAIPAFMDARSLLPILRDQEDRETRDTVFTCFNYMNNYAEQDEKYPTYMQDLADRFDNYRPMRGLHSTRYTYVWNGWANGTNEIPMEMSSSQTIRRLLRATGHDDRAEFETFRTREEFYDTVDDPGCLNNRILDSALAEEIDMFRRELLRILEQTHDQEAPNYRAYLDGSLAAAS